MLNENKINLTKVNNKNKLKLIYKIKIKNK